MKKLFPFVIAVVLVALYLLGTLIGTIGGVTLASPAVFFGLVWVFALKGLLWLVAGVIVTVIVFAFLLEMAPNEIVPSIKDHKNNLSYGLVALSVFTTIGFAVAFTTGATPWIFFYNLLTKCVLGAGLMFIVQWLVAFFGYGLVTIDQIATFVDDPTNDGVVVFLAGIAPVAMLIALFLK